MKTIWDLERNDVPACIDFYEDNGGATPNEIRVMIRLQDDPTELLAIMKYWKPKITAEQPA